MSSMFKASKLLSAGSRRFASTTSVKPPLDLYGLSGTYATALYTAAAKENSLPAVSTAMGKLQSLFVNDKRSRDILVDPTLTVSDKNEVISIISKKCDGNTVFKGFLETMAGYNRLDIIEDVTSDFQKLKNASEGLVEATVTSAKPLDAATLKKLTSSITDSSVVGKGRKLKLTNVVDESIKGGIVVNVGDKTLDLSVSSMLYKYNNLLTTPV
ncbi:F1F0 ATP synthase subunit 5 [Starmerella bacillaris]|uniref:ATP synthase subunit 5, mitochondrial n=1 Tax=Starmerella bacillaris TaxID=1247836 RepID=A0AAV5RMG4_STABA|nr:F1F0 ATP synthase subunit 5 [Starmerella bacillaris]